MSTANILDYVAGDSIELRFQCFGPDGVVLNLAGATARWGVAKRISSAQLGPVLVTKSTEGDGPGIVVTDLDEGRLTVTLEAGDLGVAGDLWHELEVTTAGGESLTVAAGMFRSRPAMFTN